MSKVSLAGNASGTGIFTIASPNSNTDRTLTLPDNTGTLLSTASTITQNSGPAFSAYRNATQTISSGTFTKFQANIERFDTASCYDTSTNRFTPNVAGYYSVKIGNWWTTGTGSTAASIFRNGSAVYTEYDYQVGGLTARCEGLLYLNGTTDYVEAYLWQSSGSNQDTDSSAVNPGFQAFLVRTA